MATSTSTELSGRVAFVTGAASGVGAAIARRLVANGASVIAGDVRYDDVRALAADIGARACRLDVTAQADWDAAVGLAVSEFGRLDVLVNNAGVMEVVGLTDATPEHVDRTLSVNLLGCVLGIRTAGRVMSEAGGGSIVNIGSVVATTPCEGLGVYAASKAGIAALTKVAAMELGPAGVRVNVVRPGGVDTEMGAPGGIHPPFYARMALGRIGGPAEIAEVVAFVASERASYMTGGEVLVDGGWTAGRYAAEMDAPVAGA